MKLTPWFSGDQKPARPGVYQRDYGHYGVTSELWFSRWSNGKWHCPARLLRIAGRETVESARQSIPWRGILRNGK